MGGSSGVKVIDDLNPMYSGGTAGLALNPAMKYLSQTGDAMWKLGKSPFEIASDVARLDIKNATKNFNKAVGSGVTLGMGPTGTLANTDAGQKLLNDKNVDRYSGGMSGDYAGTVRGGSELQSYGETSQEYWDDAMRFGAKVGVIGAASAGYEAYKSAEAVGGSAIPEYLATAKTYAGYGKDVALYGTAATALAKGDVKGAYEAAKQADNSWLPQLPNMDMPDWMPDFGGLLDDLLNSGGNKGPQVNDPYGSGTGGLSGSPIGFTPQKASAAAITLGGVALVAYMLIKKKVL